MVSFFPARSGGRPSWRAVLLGCVLTLVVGHAPLASAQDTAEPFVIASFDDLLKAVAESNKAIHAAAVRADALESTIRVVGALPDPTVSVGVFPFPIHTARGEQLMQLRVEQMVPWPGKRDLMRTMAAMEAHMGQEEVARLRAEASLEAMHAAMGVAQAEARVAEVRRFQERLKRFEAVALARYENGEGEQQHVWKLQLALAAQEQAFSRFADDREAAVAAIAQHVHRPVVVPEGAFPAMAPLVAAGSPEERSEYRRMDAGISRAAAARETARLVNRPDWGLSATWMTIVESDMPAMSDGRDALGLGVMVRIPLGRQEQVAREEAARLQEDAMREAQDAFVASWQAMWAENAVRLAQVEEQLAHLDSRLLPVAESMLESSMQAYAAGRSGFLDLLDAERTAFDLRMQRIELATRQAIIRWTRVRLSGQWDIPSEPHANR
jgi:cobalt-zinc-cadmium efflux system outer membrane protein